MTRVLFAVLIVAMARTCYAADEDELTRSAMNNMGHEIVECAAFYNLTAAAMAKRNDAADVVKRAQDVSRILIERALIVANEIGQKQEAILARHKMALDSMMEMMSRDLTNYSIVLERYASPCKEVADNPDGRMHFWVNKTIEDHGGR